MFLGKILQKGGLMKFYHYITKGSNVFKTGLFSFSKSPNVDLNYYIKRSGYSTQQDIAKWMDKFFKGYSRGIRCFSEPIKWYPHSQRLKEMVDSCDLLLIDADKLQEDGLLEKIYINPALSMDDTIRKEQCATIEKNHNDGFYPIEMKDISKAPVDWTVCDDVTGRRFAFVPFYFLILKDGVIPPQYLKKVANCEKK